MSTMETPRLVVVTGGPGAGKTALLEVVKRHYRDRVVVLPEAASMLFSGGFPRRSTEVGRKAAQRAIFRVQRELERIGQDDAACSTVLCDRGTVDGVAYWPGDPTELFRDMGTTLEGELARYTTVLHLRTPHNGHGYNQANPARIENVNEALAADERILVAWQGHPRRFVINSAQDFMNKVAVALEIIDREIQETASPVPAAREVCA